MVPNIYIQQLSIHSGEEKKKVKNKMKQKKKNYDTNDHIQNSTQSLIKQGQIPTSGGGKNLQFEGQREQIKKRKLYICPSPTEVFQTCCSLTKMFRMYDFKGRSLYTKKLLAFLLVKNYGRKAHSSEFQTWSKKACSDCSN